MEKIFSAPATTRCRASLIGLGCFLGIQAAWALDGDPARLTRPMEEGWLFRFGGSEEAALAGQVAGWPTVRLPHTWNATDGADGGGDYARGAGWYVRRFRLDPAWAQRRVFIQFDGANRVATVWLNGRKIGEHAGGFTRFRFDLTEALVPGAENMLAVRVTNADDGLAPVTADFTFFGGLYRGVKLLAVDPRHIDVMDYASDGVYVTPREVSADRAVFSVAVRLKNDSPRAGHVLVRTVVRDAQGTAVATNEEQCKLPAHGEGRSEHDFTLDRPHLWNGRADPFQYRADVSVMADGDLRDEVRQRFGLRSFRVDPDRGFFLNGAHLGLHGVSRHQDRAGQGWAVSPEDEREDFALIAEIGANAIRVAHYPQSPLWFDLADQKGMVLWAEIPVVNEVPTTDAYAENARQQLRELIRQNYNRPAICFWGVGNETREVGETSGRAQPNGPASDRLIADLARLVTAEDSTRLSVYASHHRADDTRNFHTDVLGFNKYFGWYGGAAEDFAAWADGVHGKYPRLAFAMSEYGAGANIRQHELSGAKPVPGGEWHPEEYQARYHEIWWEALSQRDYIWGKFVWNMFDFAADIRAEGGMPGINDKGLVTYDRKTKKDAFYWYQANWSTVPVLHIASQRWTERPAGKTELKVYSNAAQVELFVNGVSCGIVASDTRIFRWDVELATGVNRVVARAPASVTALADECIFTGRPPEKP
jgi:beta-galactosidase